MPAPTTPDRIPLKPILAEGLDSSPIHGAAANDAITGNPLASVEPGVAPAEEPAKPTLKDHIKKHPVLAFALGGLAIGAIAAIAGRGTIARVGRPMLAKAVRPALLRAAAGRPFDTAKLVARYPKAAARIAAGLRPGR